MTARHHDKNRFDFEFRLRVDADENAFLDELADELIDAGCHDATFSVRYGTPFAEFTRQADDLSSAVLSAIQQAESVDGVRVVEVKHQDWLTPSAIADRVGRSRQSIQQLIAGDRGPAGFPGPAPWIVGTKVYPWHEVASWLREHTAVDVPGPSPEVEFLDALNGALKIRDYATRLGEREREAVEALALAAFAS
jgi:hypothetical protein